MIENEEAALLLSATIQRILEYFGVYESTIEESRSMTQKGIDVFVSFTDEVNKPWIIAFFWPDSNHFLDKGAYIEKVYVLARRIILDFIQQGAVLKGGKVTMDVSERNNRIIHAPTSDTAGCVQKLRGVVCNRLFTMDIEKASMGLVDGLIVDVLKTLLADEEKIEQILSEMGA